MWKTTLLHAIPLWNLWPSKLVRPITQSLFVFPLYFPHNYHIVLAYLNSLPCLIGHFAPPSTHISKMIMIMWCTLCKFLARRSFFSSSESISSASGCYHSQLLCLACSTSLFLALSSQSSDFKFKMFLSQKIFPDYPDPSLFPVTVHTLQSSVTFPL